MLFDSNDQMLLVSSKNIHICLTHPFGAIGLKFFMGTQEIIIYRLVMRNS